MNDTPAPKPPTSVHATFSMFALGCFVGGTLTIGFGQITAADYVSKITFAFGAAFAGPVFTLISFFGGQKTIGDGLFSYPVGLLMALLWWYAWIAVRNVEDHSNIMVALGIIHFAGLFIATVFCFLYTFYP